MVKDNTHYIGGKHIEGKSGCFGNVLGMEE
jgi:hypothetical protein